jgi:uncharacterized protein YoxC
MINNPEKPSKKEIIQNLEKLSFTITEWVGSVSSLIVHTLVFIGAFSLLLFDIPLERILLVLTTILSLEAIYMAIFIQMSVNRNTRAIENVEKDIDEIQEDVEEIAEDVEEIQEDVEEIAEDVEEIQEDVEEIAEDVEEIQEDIDEIQEDTEEDKKI